MPRRPASPPRNGITTTDRATRTRTTVAGEPSAEGGSSQAYRLPRGAPVGVRGTTSPIEGNRDRIVTGVSLPGRSDDPDPITRLRSLARCDGIGGRDPPGRAFSPCALAPLPSSRAGPDHERLRAEQPPGDGEPQVEPDQPRSARQPALRGVRQEPRDAELHVETGRGERLGERPVVD